VGGGGLSIIVVIICNNPYKLFINQDFMPETISDGFLRQYSVKGERKVCLPIKGIEARVESPDNLPTVGHLLGYLSQNHDPAVILPDGGVLTASYDDFSQIQFDDNTARLLAKQYDGIFFPAHLESGSFKFADFLSALKRVIPNSENKGEKYGLYSGKKIAEMARQQGFGDLEQEAEHLDDVSIIMGSYIGVGDARVTDGIIGDFHQKGQQDSTFTPRGGDYDSSYDVSLALLLNGFGYYHLNVSKRGLVATFDNLTDIRRSSAEITAIKMFVNAKDQKLRSAGDKSYSVSVDFKEYEKGKAELEKIKFSMFSPELYFTSNEKMEFPVMKTQDMLPVFRDIADKIGLALSKAAKNKEKSEKKHRQNTARNLGLEVLS